MGSQPNTTLRGKGIMLADLFAEIENSDFAANMRILSGMTMVLRMLEEEDSLLRLVESVKALPAT